jgi:hypothetical protein
MANSHVLIQSQTLGTSALTVTFSSISGAYRDLYLVANGISTSSATATDAYFRVNGDSTNSYTRVTMIGSSSSPTSTSSGAISEIYMEGWSTSNPLQLQVSMLDYAQTDKHKTFLIRGGNAESGSVTYTAAARWASTSAITSITLYCTDQKGGGSADSWAAGSTFYLYGVSA